MTKRFWKSLAFSASAAAIMSPVAAIAQDAVHQFNIPAQDLGAALRAFGQQSGQQMAFDAGIVRGKQSAALVGGYSAEDGLQRLLEDTGLHFMRSPAGVLVVDDPNSPTRLGDASGAVSSYNDTATAEILVQGNRSLNADIRRTENDTQPYVVFSGDEIRQSGALSVEEFLRDRLPMNSQPAGSLQDGAYSGEINLRGLGFNQTLILVDGRRVPGVSLQGDFAQPNINGISPSMIDRIEILPATASGIYGGGATGGVINIILKRDYSGLEIDGTYGADSAGTLHRSQVGANGGLSLLNGRTRLMISAARSEQDALLRSDRDFYQRAVDRLLQNNAASPSLPVLAWGSRPNVFSATTAPLVLDAGLGGTALNSRFTSVALGYAGPASDNAQSLVSRAGLLNNDGDRRAILLSAPTNESFDISLRQVFTPWLEGFVDVYGNRSISVQNLPQGIQLTLQANNANNPFQQNIRVNVPLYDFHLESRSEVETHRETGGLIAQLPFGWRGSLEYSRAQNTASSEARSLVGLTSQGQTTLESMALRDPALTSLTDPALFSVAISRNPGDASLEDSSLRMSGPVANLPGGRVTLSALLESQRQWTDGYVSELAFPPGATTYQWTPPASQEIRSAYLELRAPVVGSSNALPLLQELEVTAAYRHDVYDSRFASSRVTIASLSGPFPSIPYAVNEFDSNDYTVGLRYSPYSGLAFRATYATGFLPPSLPSLLRNTAIGLPINLVPSNVTDPRRGNTPLTGDPVTGLLTLVSQGNPDLQPEHSRSISYGLVFDAPFLRGLRVSLDYLDIRKTDEITTQGAQFFLDNESSYSGRVQRATLTPSDAALGYTAGPITYIDTSLVNLARNNVRAVDFQVDYDFNITNWGHWHSYLIGTRQLRLAPQALASDPAQNKVGYVNQPLEWRANIGLEWNRGPLSAGWNAQYFDSYNICSATQTVASCNSLKLDQGGATVPAQVYHDLFVSYRFDSDRNDALSAALNDAELTLTIQNVFDTSPPILARNGYSTFGDPALREVALTLRKHF